MNKYYLEKADRNTPALHETQVFSDMTVQIVPDTDTFFGARVVRQRKSREVFTSGDQFVLDFGDHRVGFLSFQMRHDDVYLDAPVRLKLRFGETAYELFRSFESYCGSLCASWLQEEVLNLDLPGKVTLPRRYCFRYLEVTVVHTPRPVRLTDFEVCCITSADLSRLDPLPAGTDPLLVSIDRVAAKTLAECMQTAYEDGPKRDRRLWTGDLRLQALTDYYLFKNHRLVRRCLYLFAACEEEGKYLPGCLYQKPAVFFDEGMGITDYAMLWCVALWDYYEHTGDQVTVRDLYPVARRQMDLACALLGAEGFLDFLDGWNAFIDWAPDIQRRVPCTGVVLYALEKLTALAQALGDESSLDRWSEKLKKSRKSVYDRYYVPSAIAFLPGPEEKEQYSVQAQVWMILGGVIAGEEGKAVLRKCLQDPDALKPVTPYMHHYVVEAMITLGMKEEALEYIKSYWGGMIAKGADTFWEAYEPNNPALSPYGDPMINSFCHAWSCSPSYFIRKYYI